ncbi:MAG: hypothetical protein CBC11_002425 [Proteobacteria bacterium TMED51]|jgi:drug/metabolite transporter (DMT)-like permease|nr:MAG: hypothetical protein CBC11_011485 [Proteobacteria bacterium TMED51]RPG02097.1 MAG: hypothetical protein CBC11_002425 [Proteobacteria bacterium TMED51]HBP84045.1 hypothetical protein [Gammaproteobacteria bacterium]|tara:strand:+ start:25942 stop:26169 length:228 start_codon:yes stop_codon:yes gene_type:complete
MGHRRRHHPDYLHLSKDAAFTLAHAAYVRALGRIELIFAFLASVFFFQEKVSRAEIAGVILLSGAIILIVLEKAA